MVRSVLGVAVLMAAWAFPAASWAENLIEGGDTATLPAFSVRFSGTQSLSESGNKHWQWTGNCWDSGAQGEIFLNDAPVAGKRAIGLRNLSGRASIQFYNWRPLPLSAGARYALTFSYLAEGSASGGMIIKGRTIKEVTHPLNGTNGAWKRVKVTITPKQDGDLSLTVQNYAEGSGNTLYLADISLEIDKAEQGAASPAPSPTRATRADGVAQR